MNGYPQGVSNKKRREGVATHWRGLPSEGQRSINERRFTVQVKFYFAISLACMWVALAVVLSLPWLHGLSNQIGEIPALASVGVLAYLPGLIMAFLLFSLMQDKQPPFRLQTSITPVTVLIAARNEANNIGPTLRTISMQDYGGPISVIVVENASTDSTDEAAREAAAELNLDCTVINEPRPRKFNALNRGLNHVTTPGLGLAGLEARDQWRRTRLLRQTDEQPTCCRFR
jgi:biofilm PGA synthesis N-glycosyltransferase PgaC